MPEKQLWANITIIRVMPMLYIFMCNQYMGIVNKNRKQGDCFRVL